MNTKLIASKMTAFLSLVLVVILAACGGGSDGPVLEEPQPAPQIIGGILDSSFGTDGIVVHDNAAGGNGSDWGYSNAFDANGRILVTGYSWNNSANSDMLIWRYNSDGTLDTAFGADGVVVHDNAAGGSGNDAGFSITIDSNGRILVSGYSAGSSGNAMVIWCYNEDGILDTSFGVGGMVVYDSGPGSVGNDLGNTITTDSNGRILVSGYGLDSSGVIMATWRYNNDGSPDTTFGTDGVVIYDNTEIGGQAWDVGPSICIDPDGQILVTGYYLKSSGDLDLVLLRFNPDGTLDTLFGTDGIVMYDNAGGGGGDARGYSVIVTSTGKILVTGYVAKTQGNSDMAVWRYNADGTPDNSFGTNGIVVHSNAGGGDKYDIGFSMAADSSGRIVVNGLSWNSSSPEMAVWRYNPDGTIDASFGCNGFVLYESGNVDLSTDGGFSTIIDANGRILVTGVSTNSSGGEDMTIWCYLP